MLALFHAHSGLRYLVLLAGLVDLVYFGVLVGGGRTGGRPARILMSVFTGLLDLQVLLGILLVVTGVFYPALLGHILMMLLAVAAAHGAAVAARRAEPRRAERIRLLGVLVALALIVGGVLAIGRSLLGSAGPSLLH